MQTAEQLVAAAKAQIEERTVQQLASALTDLAVLVIDVREVAEFQQSHIEAAVNLPRGVLEMRLAQHPAVAAATNPQDALSQLAARPIYLICRSGARSALATQSLKLMGFQQVYSVAGGFQAWLAAELPVV